MSYEPTNWKKGDKITSVRLNKIENGIQGNDSEIGALKEDLNSKVSTVNGQTPDANGNVNVQGRWSDTAVNLLEQAGTYIPFTSGGATKWAELIAQLRNIPLVTYSVTWTGQNYTKTNNAESAAAGGTYECIVSPASGYRISAITVTMGGQTVTPTESGGSYTISIASVTGNIAVSVTSAIDDDVVDICLFGGQSNMDGRGTAKDATAVTTGLAYKWDNSNNRTVAFEAEGSLIPAYMQEYTSQTGVSLVEVKEAIGGTGIAQYISDYLPLATTMLTRCKAYLEGQGKTVRRCFMLWCQGESDVDGDLSTGTTAYENYFATLKSTVMQAGVNQIFIINIGQASNGTFDFAPIRTALQEVCNGTDVIMASDKLYNATSYMKDRWHYTQLVYNVVGKDSASNTIAFFNGQTPDIKHFDSSDVFGVPTEYGTLTDWTYTLVNGKVRLDAYNGNNANVRVYHQYLLDGYFYEARIASSPTASVNACFTANTVIESVSVDNGVRMMNPNGNSDADNAQSLGLLFKNCTNLKSFSVGAEFPTPADCEQMCKGATNFETFNFEPKGSLSQAFTGTKVASVGNLSGITNMLHAFNNNTALTSVGDIDGTYTTALSAFQGDSALESIGKIGSTALANINIMFNGCTSLAGVVRFESASISSATNAFNNCDLSKITIEVPANSTTYTTISTAYPTANIVTF